MQDPKLQELANAYLQQTIDFQEYRRSRTEYIDDITGFKQTEEPVETPEKTDDSNAATKTKKSLSNASVILLITITTTILILFWMLTDTGSG